MVGWGCQKRSNKYNGNHDSNSERAEKQEALRPARGGVGSIGPIDRSAVEPQFLVPSFLGAPPIEVRQYACRFAAAGRSQLSPRFSQPFVDRVNGDLQDARRRFGIVSARKEPKGFLLSIRQGAGLVLHAHESSTAGSRSNAETFGWKSGPQWGRLRTGRFQRFQLVSGLAANGPEADPTPLVV